MNYKIIPLFLFSVFISSCSKLKEEKINGQDSKNCESIPDSFKNTKITNGCANHLKSIAAENSTVMISFNFNNGIAGSCTGTVISNHFVLTAAHCINKELNNGLNQIKIIHGSNAYNLLEAKSLKVQSIYTNPQYSEAVVGSSQGDIALIKTEEDLLKNGISISKITLDKPVSKEAVLSIGYGKTGQYHDDSSGLKRWSFSVVEYPTKKNIDSYLESKIKFLSGFKTLTIQQSHDKAHELKYLNKQYAPSAADVFLMNKKVANDHGQTCKGDSGGPQFVMRQGEAVLISATMGLDEHLQGLVNSEIFKNKLDDCNLLDTSLNTRIAPYIDWIRETMKPFNEQPTIMP